MTEIRPGRREKGKINRSFFLPGIFSPVFTSFVQLIDSSSGEIIQLFVTQGDAFLRTPKFREKIRIKSGNASRRCFRSEWCLSLCFREALWSSKEKDPWRYDYFLAELIFSSSLESLPSVLVKVDRKGDSISRSTPFHVFFFEKGFSELFSSVRRSWSVTGQK